MDQIDSLEVVSVDVTEDKQSALIGFSVNGAAPIVATQPLRLWDVLSTAAGNRPIPQDD